MPVLLFGQVRTLPTDLPVVVYNELKTYLSLTDAQVQSLQGIQTSRGQASQAIYTQISEKYSAFNSLLASDTATAAQLGQLLLDIRGLQRQVPQIDGPFKTQAVNVLTQDQKNKLPALAQALQLGNTAWQAISLLLIEGPPSRVMPVPLPGFSGPEGIHILPAPSSAPFGFVSGAAQ